MANPLPDADVLLQVTAVLTGLVGALVRGARRNLLRDGEPGRDPARGRDVGTPADAVRLGLLLADGALDGALCVAAVGAVRDLLVQVHLLGVAFVDDECLPHVVGGREHALGVGLGGGIGQCGHGEEGEGRVAHFG